MQRRSRIALTAGIAVVVLGGTSAAVVGAKGDDTDTPVTGTELERASSAALAETGQGRVTGTEVGDEDSYYEIEVTLDNGSQVDVQLDRTFKVVKTMSDTEHENGDDGQD